MRKTSRKNLKAKIKTQVSKIMPDTKFLPLTKVLPSMITLSSIVAGMTAILLASRGEFEKAVIAIILAAVFDAFDGRVAPAPAPTRAPWRRRAVQSPNRRGATARSRGATPERARASR